MRAVSGGMPPVSIGGVAVGGVAAGGVAVGVPPEPLEPPEPAPPPTLGGPLPRPSFARWISAKRLIAGIGTRT